MQRKSRVLQYIPKNYIFKQNTTRLFSIKGSCQVGIKPFVWAGQACTLWRTSLGRFRSPVWRVVHHHRVALQDLPTAKESFLDTHLGR